MIDPASHSVLTGGKATRLRPICWGVLMYIAERHGEIVATDTLLEAVWTGRAAEPAYVRKAIHEIRAALKDHDGRIVKTVPRAGYMIDTRAIGDVGPTEQEETASQRIPSAGQALTFGRLSSGDYKSISRRLRRARFWQLQEHLSSTEKSAKRHQVLIPALPPRLLDG
jgi:DNA-binding winged helix-turn-helix (wHTH) protein